MENAKLIDAGIDYLRLTSNSAGGARRFLEYFRNVEKRDLQLGYKTQKGGAFGFLGDKVRHAMLGRKLDWYMLQVSGYEAKQGHMLANAECQCSRIDLQLTVFVGEENVAPTLRAAYNGACACASPERKHMRVNLIESRRKEQTVYIGSRASDIFFRCYDKFAESSKEEYRGCVRYELELKGRASKALWRSLQEGSTDLATALQSVISMLFDRGVIVPVADITAHSVFLPPRQKTSLESSLTWLSKQVAPAIMKLARETDWMTLFSALFTSSMTKWEMQRTLRYLTIYWGS